MNPSLTPASSLLGNSGKGRGSYGAGYGQTRSGDWGELARTVSYKGGCFDGEDWVGVGTRLLCTVSQGGITAL